MENLYIVVGFLFNLSLVHSDLVLTPSPAALPKDLNWLPESLRNTSFEGAPSNGQASLLEVRHHLEQEPPVSAIFTQLENSVAVPTTRCCEDVVNAFKEDFAGNSATFTEKLGYIKQPERLGAQNCLRGIANAYLNPPEISIVKESVDLHFGAIWLWNKIATYLLTDRDVPAISKRFFSGVPPPIYPGDTVKLFESETTILHKKEYLVASVQPDNHVDITSGGDIMTVPRERLLLTISAKHVGIADRALKNELVDMADDDPSLLADIEEVFKATGIGENYEQSQRSKDPRFLLAAMKKSETFHFLNFVNAIRELPGMETRRIQSRPSGLYKDDPSKMSTIYTATDAVKAYELLQLIRGHTVLENCKPLTHKNLYGTANELVSRMLENAKFEAMNLHNHDVLYAVLENQCRTTAFFVFPQASDHHNIIVPKCVKAWEGMRTDWSQLASFEAPANLSIHSLQVLCLALGQLAPGYLRECNARCMSSVFKRNIWFDKSRVKRKVIGKDHLMAGDVTRFSTFYSEGDLTYLDLVGGQAWRMAMVYLVNAPDPVHIGHEAQHLLSLVSFLNTEKGKPVVGMPTIEGFGLPNVQLLALKIATDLRHHASIAGANLQRRAEMRKAAQGSVVFSSFFRLLSCRLDDDAEWLHKRFLPFASLAIRIALFLRVEVEEQSRKGWYAAVQVFGLGGFNDKAFRKVAGKMEGIAKKFIEKFMGGFEHKATGKLEKITNRIKKFFKRKRKTAATDVTTLHRIGHIFAKLMLFMWTIGGKRQFDSQSSVDKNFYLARMYQALTILNHGENPVKPIINAIKVACKKTQSLVRHDNWDLLARKNAKIGSFADELGVAAAWGFATGSNFSELLEAGHALAEACKDQGSLDLTDQHTSYRILLEHHQCMKLQYQARRFLKLALRNVMKPPEEIVNQLFLFIKQIHAIHDDEKVLFEAYLKWQRNRQAPSVISEWNASIDVFKCSWHTSKGRQDTLLSTIIPHSGKSTATGLAFGSETCSANTNGSLDMQQEQQDVLSTAANGQAWF
ncbi:hypothetical protein Esti_005796 [Eimeria stiedai]